MKKLNSEIKTSTKPLSKQFGELFGDDEVLDLNKPEKAQRLLQEELSIVRTYEGELLSWAKEDL